MLPAGGGERSIPCRGAREGWDRECSGQCRRGCRRRRTAHSSRGSRCRCAGEVPPARRCPAATAGPCPRGAIASDGQAGCQCDRVGTWVGHRPSARRFRPLPRAELQDATAPRLAQGLADSRTSCWRSQRRILRLEGVRVRATALSAWCRRRGSNPHSVSAAGILSWEIENEHEASFTAIHAAPTCSSRCLDRPGRR